MRNLNSDVNASFCQQVDDWMLLKITEKVIQRNVFLKPGLSANQPSARENDEESESLCPMIIFQNLFKVRACAAKFCLLFA